MDEPTVTRGLTREQADELAKQHRSAGAIADIEDDKDGTFRLSRRAPEVSSPDLQEGLQNALRIIGIQRTDADALGILTYAARLTPDDAAPPISTTRLFAGAVAIGQAISSNASYVAALAMTIKQEPDLAKSYDAMRELFQPEPDEAAVRRLQPQWFSRNVMQILKLASEAADV